MSFGKLYGYPGNPRTNSLLVIAKENNLDIELVDTKANAGVTSSTDYLKYNGLGKIPTFVGADGFVLTEVIAIAVYLTSQNEKTTFLGKTKQDYASILRWMSFANSEIISNLGSWFRPLAGMETPFNKKNVDTAAEKFEKVIQILESHFLINTYLVGERVTLADIFVASIVGRGYEFVLDNAWRKEHPNVNRWFETVYNQSFYKSVVPDQKFIDEAIKYTPPAKEKKEAAPKAAAPPKEAAKPKAKEVDDEEDEPVEQPKAKHPLEALGKPTFALDDWKRKYKNEETREVALPWFWENLNFDEFSIWRVDYKYNDELTQVFMTSNLIGGFFARLEASRKYIMGCASVYGEANNSVIQGAFIIRGQEALPAFDVAPDYESYEFTKLDPKKEADKEFVDNQWAWDKPAEANGKTYPHADGKIFV